MKDFSRIGLTLELLIQLCMGFYLIIPTSARQNQISVAWSNPCFELWILLHFEFRNTSIDRDDFSRLLSGKKRLNREYDKNIDNLYDLLKDEQIVAIRNAKRLAAENHSVQPANSNPGTMVYSLLESVRTSLQNSEVED